ncbi:MAG TPA: hypothetical protein VFL90_19320 [Methylomirabilota bacterium]|nr:hypothetical protein [Methylomirabilota bacterium]
MVSVALHNRFILEAFEPLAFARFAIGLMLYSLAAWAILRIGYRAHPGGGCSWSPTSAAPG